MSRHFRPGSPSGRARSWNRHVPSSSRRSVCRTLCIGSRPMPVSSGVVHGWVTSVIVASRAGPVRLGRPTATVRAGRWFWWMPTTRSFLEPRCDPPNRRPLAYRHRPTSRYHDPMTRVNRIDWLIFFGLGFIWGSSYLFIKLAVDDFGTFSLVALPPHRRRRSALDGRARIARQPLPRERRIYGHLLVMAIINITIPFLLITWAEQSVESSLAAILTSPVPALRDRAVGVVPPRRADPGQRPDRPHRRLRRRGHHHEPGPDRRGLVAPGRDRTAGRGGQLRGRRRLLAAQRPRPAADGPGRLPGHVRGASSRACSPSCRASVDRHAGRRGASSRSCGSGSSAPGVAYLFVFRLFAHWGATRTTLVAYLLPVVGIVARIPRAPGARRRPAHLRHGARDRRGRPRQQPVRPAAGIRARAADRGRLSRRSASDPRLAADREQQRPGHDQDRRRHPAATSPGRRPRRAGPSPTRRRRPSPTRAAARPRQRRHAQGDQDQQVGAERQPAADGGPPDLLAAAGEDAAAGDDRTHRTSVTDARRSTGSRRTRTGRSAGSRPVDVLYVAIVTPVASANAMDRVDAPRSPAAPRRRRGPATAAGGRGTRRSAAATPIEPATPSRSPRTTTPIATAMSGAVPRAIG